mmetsp:Transcript_9107/g.21813  ORF Transcript_9107/g.21813 Transcript_9107/m.21813 type:complete len:563 (+) Transcript_9107:75-1763(+)
MSDWTPFIDPDQLTNPQLLFFTAVYGYVLFSAAGMLSDGSELLLLVPSLAGLIGSVVLPVLGAVPDGMMVLFSGLGSDAQNQVSVGVGALAGSTIMLLTMPWYLAILGGRVDIVGGECQYTKPKNASDSWAKLRNKGWFDTGVKAGGPIATNGKLMLLTSCLFLIIQVPAYIAHSTYPECSSGNAKQCAEAAGFEKVFSIVGAVACLFLFCVYLYIQATQANQETAAKAVRKRVAAIQSGEVTLAGACKEMITAASKRRGGSAEALLESGSRDPGTVAALTDTLKPFFMYYDTDNSKSIDRNEFRYIMRDLGEKSCTQEQLSELFTKADTSKDGQISRDEFVELVWGYLSNHQEMLSAKEEKKVDPVPKAANGAEDEDGGGEEDEEEEMPEDLCDLSPEEQQKRIKMRALWKMGMGTLLVLIFSDPAVDVLSQWGVNLNINPFYVSFVLAPFASNASELVAAYSYSLKKTSSTIVISLSTLLGAACMNNTFCLAIFYVLVFWKQLYWAFTAETLTIVLVQWFIGFVAVTRNVFSLGAGLMVLCMYPIAIAFVWICENKLGMD